MPHDWNTTAWHGCKASKAQSGACAKGKESQWPDHRGAAGISWLRLASDVPHHVFVASLGTVASAGLPPRKKVAP